MNWIEKKIKIVSNDKPIKSIIDIAPKDNKCPSCNYENKDNKSEEWYYVENVGLRIDEILNNNKIVDELVFTCRKCEKKFRNAIV